MSSVLFDLPGPRARARHRIFAAVGVLLAALAVGWVLWRLAERGEFGAGVVEEMSQANIWRAYWQGLLATLSAAAVAIITSVTVGMLLAVARLSDHRFVRLPAVIWVEFFRAVPLLLLILFVFLAYSPTVSRFWALVIALTLYNGAVLAEVFRAGIKAVPRGQSEAALAVGMRKNQVMRLVLMPQAATIMLPAIISQCVIVLKDTALGVIIAYPELVRQTASIVEFTRFTFVPLLVATLIFILINYSLSRLAVYAEGAMNRRGRTAGKAMAAEHDTGD